MRGIGSRGGPDMHENGVAPDTGREPLLVGERALRAYLHRTALLTSKICARCRFFLPPMQTLHDWNLTPAAAVELQKSLRGQVRLQVPGGPIRTVTGADISFNKSEETIYAGIVMVESASM